MRGRVLNNLFDIQKETSVSGRLLAAIERQRAKNKYILWAVYALLGALVLFILYQMFGWMLPSFSSGDSDGK